MAHYDALIAAWNSVIQPPSGVTGAALLTGDTTQQKIDKVNAWTVVGSIPTTIHVTADQVFNCVDYPEFKLATAAQQTNFLTMLTTPGPLLGGSAHTTSLLVGMLLEIFPVAGVTIANLTALSKASVQIWWQAPVANNGGGLSSPVSIDDTQAAGLV